MSQGPLLDQACLLAAQGPDSEPACIPISVETMIQCTCRIPTGRASGSASSCALAVSGRTDTGLMCLSAKTPAHHTTRVMRRRRRSQTEENMGRLCDSRRSPALTDCYASRPRNTYHGLGRNPRATKVSPATSEGFLTGVLSCVCFSMRVSERMYIHMLVVVPNRVEADGSPSARPRQPHQLPTQQSPRTNAYPFPADRSANATHPTCFLPPGRGGQISTPRGFLV